MKKNVSYLLFFLLLSLSGYVSCAGIIVQFPFAGSRVELLDSSGAAEVNSKSDIYTRSLTPFDLQIRLGIVNAATEKDYLSMAAHQVRHWPVEEQEALKQSFREIEVFLEKNDIKLDLPKTIQLIKTAGKEEFEAEGYTRGNRIILCTSPRQQINAHLVAHELFHVYSRFNEAKRDKVYKIFGFRKCNKINTAGAMENRVITNPDCPFIEHYVTVLHDNKPADMVLQLFSKKGYQEGYNLGDYMNVGLLLVEGKQQKKPVMKNGKGVVFDLEQVPDIFNKIGTNTPYVLHPEEIGAEHFAMWVIGQKVPQPEFFEQLKQVLQ